MGDPHKNLKYIHVAGTNGKGSVSAMLSSVLIEAGFTTGLYTSPYISSFNERIKINGEDISNDEIAEITSYVSRLAKSMQDIPTEFELVTCIAIEYYNKKKCDIVVMEVGLGGRLDSTNAIPAPEVAVITSIGLDHTEYLGNTIAEIAAEKSGIIKRGCVTVASNQQGSALNEVKKACKREGSKLVIADNTAIYIGGTLDGQSFSADGYEELFIKLLGRHQLQNASTVLTVIDILQKNGWKISNDDVKNGLANAKWPARFEVLKRDPVFIVDGAHNPLGAQTVRDTLEELFGDKKIVFLIGLLADKDYIGIIDKIADKAKKIITVTPENPRAMPASELAKIIGLRYNVETECCENVAKGVERSIEVADHDDIICAFGSLYMSGTIRNCFID